MRLHRPVFFLCDIQEKFRHVIDNFPLVVNTARRMIRCGDTLGVPIIATEQYPKGLGPLIPELGFIEGEKRHLLPKTRFSMAIPETLALLDKYAATDVVLFGIESHVCIYQTALDLLEKESGRSVNVHVLVDGVSSRHAFEKQWALPSLASRGALLTSSESIIFQILADFKHEKAKEISGIIKETDQIYNKQ